jgi:hypothetical protein
VSKPRDEVYRCYSWECVKCGGNASFSAVEYESDVVTRDLVCPGCEQVAGVVGVTKRLPVVHLAMHRGPYARERPACGARTVRAPTTHSERDVTCKSCRRGMRR